jgi:hypothetical protein
MTSTVPRAAAPMSSSSCGARPAKKVGVGAPDVGQSDLHDPVRDWGDARALAYHRDPSGSFALRFAPIRSFGFRMPCREHSVEPAKGGERTGDVRRACALRRSRSCLDSNQPVQLRKPESQSRYATGPGSATAGLVRLATSHTSRTTNRAALPTREAIRETCPSTTSSRTLRIWRTIRGALV